MESIRPRIRALGDALKRCIDAVVAHVSLSDVHGDSTALELVVSQYGDVLIVSTLLKQLSKAQSVRGNKRRWLALAQRVGHWEELDELGEHVTAAGLLTTTRPRFATLQKNLVERLLVPHFADTLSHT